MKKQTTSAVAAVLVALLCTSAPASAAEPEAFFGSLVCKGDGGVIRFASFGRESRVMSDPAWASTGLRFTWGANPGTQSDEQPVSVARLANDRMKVFGVPGGTLELTLLRTPNGDLDFGPFVTLREQSGASYACGFAGEQIAF